MRKVIYTALSLLIALLIALPAFADGPQDFVGNWKSDPGTPTMTRKLELKDKVIVMTELQPGRNGGPELVIIRKYPTDGSEVHMDTGMWAGSKATGKMDGNVLTVDTEMPTGQKFHDVWTLAPDKKSYTNDMVISGGRGGRGGAQSGNDAAAKAPAAPAAPRAIKFSFSRTD